MDEIGTQVLPKKLPPLPPNRILPKEIDTYLANPEGASESKVPDIIEIQETQRSEKAFPMKQSLPQNQPSSENTIEGMAMKWNGDTAARYEKGYIVLYQQQLSVYLGDSKEGDLLHQYPFPHGADYVFTVFHRQQVLLIYDKNGKLMSRLIIEKQLYSDIVMEWYRTNTKLFTGFQREPAEDNTRNDFDEINYSLKLNIPTLKAFSNVYNDEFMTHFQNYPIVDGKPQIKNALEFQHYYRPNRLMRSFKSECDDIIERYMTDRDRQLIQWGASRDWSRLFVLSVTQSGYSWCHDVYLEFYDFNIEKQTLLSSPLRINFLSQLLRPQWIQLIQQDMWKTHSNQVKMDASSVSFTADSIVIRRIYHQFIIVNLKPDWTYKDHKMFQFKEDTIIESMKLSCSNLYIKSNGFWYEQLGTYFSDHYPSGDNWNSLSFDENFTETNLNNIIQCGIYDILIYDKHVKIFNNINPLNQLDEIVVDEDIFKLLKSQNFIQLDHDSIVCLPQPVFDGWNRFKIIQISQDNLHMKQTWQILLQSPWNPTKGSYLDKQALDCQFNLIKFNEYQHAVFIVTSPSKKEQFYQYYYNRSGIRDFEYAYQKPLSDYINLQQIPHLPLVNINGSQFINCDRYTNIYQLELDLRSDEQEILNQDQENINSQEVKVFHPYFIKSLLRLIEEKEEIIDAQNQSEIDISSIEIPELKTSIIIKSGGQNSGLFIFQHSIDKIKHLKIKQAIRYKTHKLIYRDTSYKVIIILSIDYALYEMQMCFNLTETTQTPFKLIMNLTEAPNEYEIYLNDDSTVSLFFPASDCCFKHFSLNSQDEQEVIIKNDFKDGKRQITIPQLSSFIQRIARTKSIQFGNLFLENFQSIIFKNAGGLIQYQYDACVFAFQNKLIFFEKTINSLTIMDDSFTVIGTVILSSKFPPSTIRIASSMDIGALEYIDELNMKFPIPILGSLQDYKSYNEQLGNYTKNFRCPMPIQFGLLDGFIGDLDLVSEKLSFYQSKKDKKDGNIFARIQIIAQKESFIDDIIKSKERKEIEEKMNEVGMNLLLSYNVNKRMNLITGTKKHAERDHIYNILYKLLEISEIKELPILIYNTSVDPNKYESILDVLIQNKAIKLALLIVSIAIKQDQVGYIYSRLYQYLQIFSANELQMVFENQIFFFKIPEDCYQEYQIVKKTLKKPFSECKTFFEIKKNMEIVEREIQKIEIDKAIMEKKDSDHPEQGKERDQLQISENNLGENEVNKVPTEYFAINLMNLLQSQNQSLNENNENHREVTHMLIKIDKIDETIIEKESFQIIIDFKWDSYARNFFSVQLGLFICFIIAFIFDVVAVSENSHLFQSDDSNQVIPRIISIAIIIPFGIYEIANIVITRKTYFESFWNLNDALLITLYVTYFITSFARPEQREILKSLQLLIVIFSFLKFCFLIRIWTQVSFLVRMVIVVFRDLLIFLIFFLLVIGGLTVMAYIIINESGDSYKGIKAAAYFVIVLRQSIGDYDTSSIIEGSKDFQILAWFLWLLILIIGNIVFMNFIIAVVSESYESCMERKTQHIYRAKLEMIKECEDFLPEWVFAKRNWFPRFIIIRREQGSSEGGDNSEEWFGFVKQMQKHLEHETNKLNDIFIQNINRSTESTKREIRTGQEEVKKVTTSIAEMKTGQEEVKKVIADVAEVKKQTAEVQVQVNEIKLILSAVFKDQITLMKAEEVIANDNKAN